MVGVLSVPIGVFFTFFVFLFLLWLRALLVSPFLLEILYSLSCRCPVPPSLRERKDGWWDRLGLYRHCFFDVKDCRKGRWGVGRWKKKKRGERNHQCNQRI